MTMADWSILAPGQYLIHDRDGKYCSAFQQTIDAVGVTQIPLPPRSPNLNAYAERWIRPVKDEAVSRLILFGERSLRYALRLKPARRVAIPLKLLPNWHRVARSCRSG